MQARSCEICGERPAKYVCQKCSRNVCQVCFEKATWLCRDCNGQIKEASSTPEFGQSESLFKLLTMGFFLVFIGMILVAVSFVFSGGTASFGGIVFVGPLPIIIGAGPNYLFAIILAFFLTVFGLVAFILLRKRVQEK